VIENLSPQGLEQDLTSHPLQMTQEEGVDDIGGAAISASPDLGRSVGWFEVTSLFPGREGVSTDLRKGGVAVTGRETFAHDLGEVRGGKYVSW